MEEVTIKEVFHELKQIHRELHEVRAALLPEEALSPAEHKELDEILAETRKGKTRPWREALKK